MFSKNKTNVKKTIENVLAPVTSIPVGIFLNRVVTVTMPPEAKLATQIVMRAGAAFISAGVGHSLGQMTENILDDIIKDDKPTDEIVIEESVED